jgi:hypothetical protein
MALREAVFNATFDEKEKKAQKPANEQTTFS